ncbi:hypothetical protein D9611_011319 [Ephemerocybe angulata]|uniref:Uncharacterized protein n=1 Tax=Ephemerocybe angulata TaxID=980116 RepID=A0A8H5BBI7_9AGAR|nr:hypothetical protein D9611_011319 [Tulosesus angulatus]
MVKLVQYPDRTIAENDPDLLEGPPFDGDQLKYDDIYEPEDDNAPPQSPDAASGIDDSLEGLFCSSDNDARGSRSPGPCEAGGSDAMKEPYLKLTPGIKRKVHSIVEAAWEGDEPDEIPSPKRLKRQVHNPRPNSTTDSIQQGASKKRAESDSTRPVTSRPLPAKNAILKRRLGSARRKGSAKVGETASASIPSRRRLVLRPSAGTAEQREEVRSVLEERDDLAAQVEKARDDYRSLATSLAQLQEQLDAQGTRADGSARHIAQLKVDLKASLNTVLKEVDGRMQRHRDELEDDAKVVRADYAGVVKRQEAHESYTKKHLAYLHALSRDRKGESSRMLERVEAMEGEMDRTGKMVKAQGLTGQVERDEQAVRLADLRREYNVRFSGVQDQFSAESLDMAKRVGVVEGDVSRLRRILEDDVLPSLSQVRKDTDRAVEHRERLERDASKYRAQFESAEKEREEAMGKIVERVSVTERDLAHLESQPDRVSDLERPSLLERLPFLKDLDDMTKAVVAEGEAMRVQFRAYEEKSRREYDALVGKLTEMTNAQNALSRNAERILTLFLSHSATFRHPFSAEDLSSDDELNGAASGAPPRPPRLARQKNRHSSRGAAPSSNLHRPPSEIQLSSASLD